MSNIIDTLTGNFNGSGTFNETYGILNANIWEHPDVPGFFINTTFGYAGITFNSPTGQGAAEKVSINFTDLFNLAIAKDINLLPKLPNVTATPASGAHPQTVTLACTQAGVSIYYTTDGSSPTTSSTLYTVPITISSALTLKAKGFRTYWAPSAILSATYT